MESLMQKHRMYISRVSMEIIRGIMNDISWEKPLVAIKGSRGVGKSTLMKQYIRKTYGINAGEALYCVMDSIYFSSHSLLDLAERSIRWAASICSLMKSTSILPGVRKLRKSASCIPISR